MDPNNQYGSAPQGVQPDYSFITNPSQPPKQGLRIPGGSSLLGRVLLVAGALVLLMILFSVFKGLLSGGSNQPEYLSIVQDQTAIIEYLKDAEEEESISEVNLNSALTTTASLTSARTETLQYMKNNKMKAKQKDFVLKIDSQVTSKLKDAAEVSNYNEVFHDVFKAQLQKYQRDLQFAYQKTTGPKGKALLSRNYKTAELLITQLDTR